MIIIIIVNTLMIPNSKDGIYRRNCTPLTTHDGRLLFLCNCPSYMSNPMPKPCITWNYFGIKKCKFKGICHLLCHSVSKSQTLVFPAYKMPAMRIHYRPLNSHGFSNSRPAALHARLDRVDDTDFFWRKMLNTLMIRFIHWFPGIFPSAAVYCPC